MDSLSSGDSLINEKTCSAGPFAFVKENETVHHNILSMDIFHECLKHVGITRDGKSKTEFDAKNYSEENENRSIYLSDSRATIRGVEEAFPEKLSSGLDCGAKKSPTAAIIVEQSNSLICCCFLCGNRLVDPNERYNFLLTQKLFCMKMDILQLLTEIIGKKIVTKNKSVDMCLPCCGLINDADTALKQIQSLSIQMKNLFENNNQPKLYYQIFPNNLSMPGVKVLKQSGTSAAERSLAELALTRPRCRKKGQVGKAVGQSVSNLSKSKTRKRGGRPRKPFQCSKCYRKFISNSVLSKHYIKFHDQLDYVATSVIQNVTNHDEVLQVTTSEKVYVPSEDPKSFIFNPGNNECVETKQEIDTIEELSTNNARTQPVLKEDKNIPIQPKPQTIVKHNDDGSLTVHMNSVAMNTASALIKVSPEYLNLHHTFHSCQHCGKNFDDASSISMHQKQGCWASQAVDTSSSCSDLSEAKSARLLECSSCNAIFSSKKLLHDHKVVAHPECAKELKKLHECTLCAESFSFKYELQKHKETHLPFNQIGPHEFLCCVCGLKVANKAALKKHFYHFHSVTHKTKNLLCAQCGYMSNVKKTFNDHLRTHSDTKENKKHCEVCNKEMLAASYKIHMLRMHGEARYACRCCDHKFTMRSDLMKHLNAVHSNMKSYSCAICGDKFKSSEALRYHKKSSHSSSFHSCVVCSRVFRLKRELKNHSKKFHGIDSPKFSCSVCARGYAEEKQWVVHMAKKHNIQIEATSAISRPDEQKLLEVAKPKETALNPSTKPDVKFTSCTESERTLPGNDQLIESTPTFTEIGLYHPDSNPSLVLTSLQSGQDLENFQSSNLLTSHEMPLSGKNIRSTSSPVQTEEPGIQSLYLVPELNVSVVLDETEDNR